MNEWKETTLAELCSDISYGYTESAKQEKIGPKFLRITDISNGKLDWNNVPYCPISDVDFKKYKLLPGDIVIARTGATTGANYTMKENDPKDVVYASYLIRYKIDSTKANSFFIGQLLKSPNWKDFVDAIAGGSAQPGANAKQLGSFEILLPPIAEQRTIATVLTSIDKKIDLLYRQNETLEQMAETLFRQWFIENPNPQWEERSLSSIATFLNGLACQKYPPENEVDKLPVLKIKDLKSGISENSDWATTKIKSEYIVKNGDIIFAWSASLMVKIWNGHDCILNQHLFKVTSENYPKWYYYLWSKHHLVEFITIAASHATTMGHIKRSDLDEAMVLIPSNEELKLFTEIIEPIIEKIVFNNQQTNKLVDMRNTLLPKLISGEIRIATNE